MNSCDAYCKTEIYNFFYLYNYLVFMFTFFGGFIVYFHNKSIKQLNEALEYISYLETRLYDGSQEIEYDGTSSEGETCTSSEEESGSSSEGETCTSSEEETETMNKNGGWFYQEY